MKLGSFSVNNYRSITKTSSIPIRSRLTVLIGPNNEGKSNILRALSLSLTALKHLHSLSLPARSRHSPGAGTLGLRLPLALVGREYDWHSDFPIPLQADNPEGMSVFGLQFKLTLDERQEFKQRIGSSINDTLPVQVSMGASGVVFSIRKQGAAAKKLTARSAEIAAFISERLRFQYIPAVRTSASAEAVVRDLLSSELALIETEPAYREALEQIERLQAPVLRRVSDNITETLREFIPDVSSVRVSISQDRRYERLRTAAEIIVDDGVETPLSSKGDGVVSLSAISLIRYAAESSQSAGSLVLAIEEPESHLHPQGIHQLQKVVREIAEQHQVIVTTHNPILVERRDIKSNIVVRKQQAKPAGSIAAVRDALGVRVGDNLSNAEVVLVVEGGHDEVALRALLAHASDRLAGAMRDNQLAVESLAGSGNLSFKIGQLSQSICRWHCVLDHDKSGSGAFIKAKTHGLLTPREVTFTKVRGMREAELEDWINPALYRTQIEAFYGPIMACGAFSDRGSKWSDRMQRAFDDCGAHWDLAVEAELKGIVAEAVRAHPEAAIHGGCEHVFRTLVATLEGLVGD